MATITYCGGGGRRVSWSLTSIYWYMRGDYSWNVQTSITDTFWWLKWSSLTHYNPQYSNSHSQSNRFTKIQTLSGHTQRGFLDVVHELVEIICNYLSGSRQEAIYHFSASKHRRVSTSLFNVKGFMRGFLNFWFS